MQMTMLIILLLTVSVTLVTESNASPLGEVSVEDMHLLSNISENLGGNMIKEVARVKPGKNVVVSAFSLLTPLAQLSLATEGASHEELLRVLGSKNDMMTRQLIAKWYKLISSIGDIELKSPSKIYVTSSVRLNSTFENDVKTVFHSDIPQVDFFTSEAAAENINRWVEDQTNNKIKNLVSAEAFDDSTNSVIVNANHLKGQWRYPFHERNTMLRDFHVSSTVTKQIPTMHKIHAFRYGESKKLDAKLLEMPYKGNKASMLIILPNKIDGLMHLKSVEPADVAEAYNDMRFTKVEVFLPKFTIKTSTNLKSLLKKIGVGRIFSPDTAQMTRLIYGDTDMFISKGFQQTIIEVSENGTNEVPANVITSVISHSGPGSVHRIMQFNANRAFYFAVSANHALVFNGIFMS